MRQTLLFSVVVGYVLAVPTGTYHQEYTYKSSSSSFKNNELQHKTDDQGYYKKDGDLEGRTKPRIDSNNEHSEYVNPNLRGSQYTGYGDNTDVNAYGTNRLAEGIASNDRLVGSLGYGAGGSGSYSSSNYDSSNYGVRSVGSNNYGSNSYGSGGYGTAGYLTKSHGSRASIQSIIQRLQQDFERELQTHQWRDSHSQASTDQNLMESQLRQNLTDRLNSELLSRYGQQTIRNGLSYSISGGQLQSAANYDNQELANLKQQLENNLLNSLRTQNMHRYGTSDNSGGSSHHESHSQSSHMRYGYSSSTVRPGYQTLYPTLPVYDTTPRSRYTNNYDHSDYELVNSNIRYTPVSHGESVSNIASSVQRQLDATLNEVLNDIYKKYFTSTSYQLTNYDVVLNNTQNDLRRNITYLFDETLRRNYGSQTQRDGYLFSIGSNGQVSNEYNYALRDLEDLKDQVERNLMEKLNRQFHSYRNSFASQSHSFASQSNSVGYDQYITTPRYIYTSPRAQYSSGIKTGHQNQYGYVAGSRQSGYEMSGGSYDGSSAYSSGTYGSTNLGQLQNQLQDELSRQLQAAITRDSSSYSSSGSYSPQNYQTSLQQLTDELNRNVTRHLQEYSASASYSASGNYDSAQIDNLKNQLLSSLTRQLQQNLQQHLQSASSSAYRASSSSNYRPVRGFTNHQQDQYTSGGSVRIDGECGHCDMSGYRRKRSPHQPYRSRPLSQFHESGYRSNYGYSGSYSSSSAAQEQQRFTETGQELDDSEVGQQEELGQEVEEIEELPHSHSFLPKPHKIQQENSGQQVEEEYEQLHTGQQQQEPDMGQQVVEEEFENLNLGQVVQEMDDSELTQQVEVEHPHISQSHRGVSSLPQIGHSVGSSGVQREHNNRQTDNLHSQVQDSGHTVSHINQQHSLQPHEISRQIDNSDLNQQTEEFDALQVGQQAGVDNIEQIDSDIGVSSLQSGNLHINQNQHTHHSGFSEVNPLLPVTWNSPRDQGTLGGYEKPEQHELGQELDNSDLTQQTEDSQTLEAGQQQVDDEAGQTVENSHVIQVSSGGHQVTQNQQSGYTGYSVVEPITTEDVDNLHTGQQQVQSNVGHGIDKVAVSFIQSGNEQLPNQIQKSRLFTFSQVNQLYPAYRNSATNQLDENKNIVHGLHYWLSHEWKPSQERFIERSRQCLINKLEEALKSKQMVQYKRDEMLNELAVNLTKEINSHSEDYLTHYLELTHEEIEGVKAKLFEDLRNKYDKATHTLTQQTQVDSTDIENQQTHEQKPVISSGSHQIGREPENAAHQLEQDGTLHPITDSHNEPNINRAAHGLNNWLSYEWNPNQEKFYKNSRQKLFTNLEDVLKKRQIHNNRRYDILRILAENLTNEINMHRDEMQLTPDEIRGIKVKVLGDLLAEYDRRQQNLNHSTNVGLGLDITNSGIDIPANNLQLGEIPDNIGQQSIQDEDSLYTSGGSDNGNMNSLGSTGAQTVSTHSQHVFSTTQNILDSGTWDEKQRIFIKQLDTRLMNDFTAALQKGQYKNYGNEEINRELSQQMKNALENYNQQFLVNYVGLNKEKINNIQAAVMENLRNEWRKHLKPVATNNIVQSHGQISFVSQSPENNNPIIQTHVIPSSNLELIPDRREPLSQELPKHEVPSVGLTQQNSNQFDGITLNHSGFVTNAQDSSVGTPNTHRQTYVHHSIENHQGSSYISSGYSTPKKYPHKQPARLPDSNAFISTEIDQHRNAQYGSEVYQPLGSKSVIEEEQQRQTTNSENTQPLAVIENQPQRLDHQISQDSQTSENVGRVTLQKSTGQLFGLSSQGEISTQHQTRAEAERTAEDLIEKLRQNRNKPLVRVVEQNGQPDQGGIHESVGAGVGTSFGQVHPTGYGTTSYIRGTHPASSVESSYPNQPNEDNGYVGKLNYGHQEEVQQSFETTGHIGGLEVGQANLVEPYRPSNSYSGVKGHRRPSVIVHNQPSYETPGLNIQQIPPSSTFIPEVSSETHELTTIINQEDLPWWKRFGNKVKQGAVDLKEKIIG